jgi:spermine/spermidine synthase
MGAKRVGDIGHRAATLGHMARLLPDPRRPLPPFAPLAGAPVRLLLTSATVLFVELLLIRWIPANVRYVGFFANFLLMSSFLGIGLGILLGRRGVRLPISPFPILLLATVLLVYGAQLNIQARDPNEFFFGLEASTSADTNFVVLPLLVVLVTALIATLALPLGPLLRAMPPLRAYAIDIAGSMLGITAFATLAFLQTDPTVWFAITGILLLLLALGSGLTPWSAIGGAAMAVVIVSTAIVASASGDVWSPYYRISAWTADRERTSLTDPTAGQPFSLSVDGIPHQNILDGEAAKHSQVHDQVYRWFPGRTFGRVLIIGAGTGSDVALALARGASHVDAVEIDPGLAAIGRRYHPEHVYDDPRVTVHVNDGRAFLNATTERYDLVVYALTDSLTLASSAANVRLESFLFTEESFGAARDHLAPAGLFIMYNLYRERWIVAKLDSMLNTVFGQDRLLRLVGRVEAVLAAGPAVTALHGAPPPGDLVDAVPDVGAPTPQHATDDWPFLYLRTATVAPYYLAALAFILVFALIGILGAARVTSTPIRRFSPHFFVLGIAFMLLETKSLVSFSLLFGTTWIVNALAFFAILASVLLAIGINARFRPQNPVPLYAALFAAIALAYLVPPDRLLIEPAGLRYLIAGAIAFAPVFFANLVFTHSFRETDAADMAFASNLVGAMVGGAMEYLALVTGFRALLIVVVLLYGSAYVLSRRFRLLADRDLAYEPPAGLERAPTG